jgi:adenine phosphoribosyltransferase
MNLKETIRSIPHWPIESVTFRDITTLMQNPEAFKQSCDLLYERYKGQKIDKIVAIDARGFVFGAVLAYKLNIGIIPVRKKGKLPSSTISADYSLEYGVNSVEIHDDSISKGESIVIVDDLIATGGTVAAAVQLVEQLGGNIIECAFIIELPDLHGRDKISKYPVFSLVEFEGE